MQGATGVYGTNYGYKYGFWGRAISIMQFENNESRKPQLRENMINFFVLQLNSSRHLGTLAEVKE